MLLNWSWILIWKDLHQISKLERYFVIGRDRGILPSKIPFELLYVW
jgi:hypothetical protein